MACGVCGGPPRPPCGGSAFSGTAITMTPSARAVASAKIRYPILLLSSDRTALFFSGQAFVNGFDEGAGGTGFGAELRLIGPGRMGVFDLIESHPLLDHGRDHIADDHHHIAIIHNVQLLAEAPVTGDHIGTNSLVNEWSRWNRKSDQPVQGIDLSLYAATSGNIDHRKAGHVKDVSGNHDIRSPKKNEAVG